MNGERKLAMFIDFENIARGVKEAQYKQFELKLVLERLLERIREFTIGKAQNDDLTALVLRQTRVVRPPQERPVL